MSLYIFWHLQIKGISSYYNISPNLIFSLWIRSIKAIAKPASRNQKLSTKPFIILCLFYRFWLIQLYIVFTLFFSLTVRRRFVKIEIYLIFKCLVVVLWIVYVSETKPRSKKTKKTAVIMVSKIFRPLYFTLSFAHNNHCYKHYCYHDI